MKGKIKEYREQTVDELKATLESLSQETFQARFQLATNQLTDTAAFRRNRHLMAQINTVLNEKQLQQKGEN